MAAHTVLPFVSDNEFREYAEGHSNAEVAGHFGVSSAYVTRRLSRLGIRRRAAVGDNRIKNYYRWAMYNEFLNAVRAMFGRLPVPPENNPYRAGAVNE